MTAPTARLKAADLMNSDVAYVTVDMTLLQLAAFLDENKIHGAPVMSANRLVGVVSRTDLARAITEGAQNVTDLSWFRMLNDEGEEEDTLSDLPEANGFPGSDLTVGEIMSTEVITVPPIWSAAQVAEEMINTGVRRVLVVDDGAVAGILSSTDLLRAIIDYEGRLL